MNAAPLPHEWMLISIIGFFVSVFFLYDLTPTWGFLFAFFSIILFVASLVSMSRDSLDPDHLDELAIHKKDVRAGIHRKKNKN